MNTRKQKKRSSRKNKSSPKKSIQKHSTVSGNNAVEVEQTVTLDHGGSLHDYRQVAWLLREKLNDLVDGENGEFPEPGLRSLLDMATSSNVVSVDSQMLNPVLWRTLSKDLLLHILARLPLPDVTRLRSLSREWRRELGTVNSDINQACDEASSSMVAVLSHTARTDAFSVAIYDIANSRWQYAYQLRLRRPIPWMYDGWEQCPDTWTPVDACDGGLVCFISLWEPTKKNQMSIAVVNLLTRVQHELPPRHYLYYTLPTMVQFEMDARTKCYKVVVAAYRARVDGLTIETYDSATGKWTQGAPPSGSIFGPIHTWSAANGWRYKASGSVPGAYDFGDGNLHLYADINLFPKESASDGILIAMTIDKDRVFDLKERTQMDASRGRRLHHSFHIVEYRLDNRTKAWVEGKSYECLAVEDPKVEELSSVNIDVCDGFLMVIFHYKRRGTYFRLLDLSTGEWRNVPRNPSSEGLHTNEFVLCRAFWNAVP